ncbi:glycosyltransferase family 4 protein [Candidatus Woesearchaeota archaeon CG_4_10_14_0_2_um_filter_33_10]|nr:MAG: glycosyltransferase family 4 protein [Candidatus Woesearchaeota archaeon CG_4_10_14_0_2_um_filter_33_10]
MKIGIFTNIYKPVINGVVNSISSFKKGLEELGHEVYIFAPTCPDYKDDEKNILRIKSVRLPLQNDYRISLPPLAKKMLDVIKQLDVIHTQHPFVMGNYGSFFADIYNKPLIFTHHTQYDKYSHYIPFEQETVQMFTRWLVKDYANKCDCVIAPSESIKKMLLNQGIKSRIEVVPTGINLDVFGNPNREIIRKKYNLSLEQKLLLYAGRIAKEKNLEFLIKSFKLVLNKKPNTYLMLVGSRTKKDYLVDLIKKLNLETKVFLVGHSNAVQNYYGAADLFVFSSVSETQGLVLVEAMAAGIPVVAVDSPGVRDVVNGKNGFMVQDSIRDFSEKVIKVLDDDKLREKMSQNARKTASSYSIQKMSKRMLKVYKSVLN